MGDLTANPASVTGETEPFTPARHCGNSPGCRLRNASLRMTGRDGAESSVDRGVSNER
jgi:hypothetical protein